MQLLVISNCKENMTRCNTSFLIITGSIPSQLQNLGYVCIQHTHAHTYTHLLACNKIICLMPQFQEYVL